MEKLNMPPMTKNELRSLTGGKVTVLIENDGDNKWDIKLVYDDDGNLIKRVDR